MDILKRSIIVGTLAFFALVFVIMLAAAFVEWSPNPSNWAESTRFAVAMFGTLFGCVAGISCGVLAHDYLTEQDN